MQMAKYSSTQLLKNHIKQLDIHSQTKVPEAEP